MDKGIKLVLGFGSLGLGVLGLFLPLLPSTCFFIAAAYFLSTVSPKTEQWMLNHPSIGPVIIGWRETRSIPHKGKVAALAGMTFSGILVGVSPATLQVKTLVFVVLIACALYVWTRPTLVPIPQEKDSFKR